MKPGGDEVGGLDADLRERNFGALCGTPYAEIEFDAFAPDYAPPGGESWDELHARVDSAWERITNVGMIRKGEALGSASPIFKSRRKKDAKDAKVEA